MPFARPRHLPVRLFTPPLQPQLPRGVGRAPGRPRGRSVARPAVHVGFMIMMGSLASLAAQSLVFLKERLRRLRGRRPNAKAAAALARMEAASASASSGAVDLKDTVRQLIAVKHYDVHDLYHTKGVWQRIARSHTFDVFTLVVVALNSAWIGFDLDYNRCPILAFSHPAFQIVEEVFTLFFVFEWFVRFKAFKKKKQALKDPWFVFDSVLCGLMVLENWVLEVVLHLPGFSMVGDLSEGGILRLARLLRLLRIARMVRLFHAFPELLILVRGMVAATRSVLTTLSLLCILLYVYALAFRQITMDIPVLRELYFSSVPKSMYTLLIQGIFMDNLGIMVNNMGLYSRGATVLFWLFLLSSSLTVMNMLIGVICEAVSSVATTEKEALQVNKVKTRIAALLEEIDHEEAQDGRVSKNECLHMMENPEAILLLHEVGVDPVALVDHVDAMFVAEDVEGDSALQSLEFTTFCDVILSLRSSCRATVRDIIDLRKFTRTIVAQTNDHLTRIEQKLDQLDFTGGSVQQSRPQLQQPRAAVPQAPVNGVNGGDQEAEAAKAAKAAKIAAMLARAKTLGAKVKEGPAVTSFTSRAKELQTACEALKRSADEADS